MLRILAVAMTFVVLSSGVARADCDHFKWSLDRERAWLAAAPEPVAAGGAVALADKAFAVALRPNAEAGFVAPPERAPKPESFGTVVNLAAVGAPGVYEITLSAEAWLDVVQNGARAKSIDFSGQKDCPGVRKSVKFELAAGTATVQISNAETASILMTIALAR